MYEEDLTMNRRLVAIGVGLAMVLAACSNAATPAPSEPIASAPANASGTAEASAAPGETVRLTIESWRNDDLSIWEDEIIPAFEASHPNIEVTFAPTAPADYNGVLNSKLAAGNAGDLITCRPFDASLALFEDGYLASLNDLPGMENFGDVAKSAWITDDGSDAFCVPMASVIHGFIYNKAAFNDLAITDVPTTEAEFHALLDQIQADGRYVPLAMGTKDMWEAATMGFQNIGPNYWDGEAGRSALIAGDEKLTDQPYVDTLTELASWSEYLPDGYEAIAYPDAQQLFASGQAAIYPAGSWDIAYFEGEGVDIGFFGPPLPEAGDTCYISDHTDIAIGLNAASPNAEAAREFLSWVASDEFATMYSNALPGFYSLSDNPVEIEDPIAQEAVDLRQSCESTIRNSYQILSRGEPNLENELWRVSAGVINGTISPSEGATELQDGLDSWYTPDN
jgi:raffinose/stachyose/melibiose transport system substrate-binding protein